MSKSIIPIERIAQSIYSLRRQKVMLDRDLSILYGVKTRVLNQAVKRNAARFPSDFMFALTSEEIARISQIVISPTGRRRSRSQIVTLKRGQNIKYRPYAFTEQGVAMLSSVLNSERAVKVNIAIMRAFVKLREALETNRELARKFAELEKRVGKHDETIDAILDVIRQLMVPPKEPRREIGFHVREKPSRYGSPIRR
jgi:hypothetical protein